MRSKDIMRMCIQNLFRRRARTLLTALGVLIGCCSIVIMVSLGIGMKQSQERMLAEMGDLTIITVTPQQGGRGKIKLDDAAVKKMQGTANVEAATPKLSPGEYTIKLYAGANNRYVCEWSTVVGMDAKTLPGIGYKLVGGDELNGKSMDVLVGQFLAYSFTDSLRPPGSNTIDRWGSYDASEKELPLPDPYFDALKTPITMEVSTDKGKFSVTLNPTGMTKEDYSKGMETSEGIIMNLADLAQINERAAQGAKKPTSYGSVVVKVNSITNVAQVEAEIKAMGYNTSSMESIRKPMEKEAKQKQMMLGGLGAISLFVAALGITNTMIMSISERTKEIGIMKSLGCFVRDIKVMFLAEAGAIGLIGGIAGCILSYIISVIINIVSAGSFSSDAILGAIIGGEGVTRLSVIPAWLLLFALLFSICIGLGSGYYPANKAVRIPALEAIKND